VDTSPNPRSVGHVDTETYDYIELLSFSQIIVGVDVSVSVLCLVSVLHSYILYYNIFNLRSFSVNLSVNLCD
jgi:hypothetical protein